MGGLEMWESIWRAVALAGLPAVLVTVIFMYKWRELKSGGKKWPPSPPKLPVIGNLHQMSRRAHRSLHALSQRYGELIFLQLGSKGTIVISSAKIASQALRALDTAFSGRPDYGVARDLLYGRKDVIFRGYDDHWRQMRSACVLQLLTNKRVRSFRGVREEELGLVLQSLSDKGTRSVVVNLSEIFSALTNDVVCRVAFGRKYKGENGGLNFDKLLKEFIGVFGSNNVGDVFPWLRWVNALNGFDARVCSIRRAVDDLLERIFQEHSDRFDNDKSTHVNNDDTSAVKDFVDILLETQREAMAKGEPIDKDSIKSVILDVFVAGTHTGYLTMEWVFTELMRHPTVMQRLQQQVREIAGDTEFITEDDLGKMTYLKAVIKENFRLHPPIPLLVPRECIQDVKLNGYDIDAGTQVLINAWAIGRDPTCWEDPEKFEPERFLNSPIEYNGQHFELIPFGSGRRGCPGIAFAIATIELVLANLVHRFDWALPGGDENVTAEMKVDITESPGLTPHKLTPLVVVATPRVVE